MKLKSVIVIALVLIASSITLAQEPKIANVVKEFREDASEWLIAPQNRQAAKSPAVRTALFAHAYQSQLACPATIVVGVITAPAGWTDYNRRVVPFENLSIVQTAQGAQISCDYDSGRYALNRLVPGRVCTRDGATSPHMSCRAIPTKK